MERWLAPLHFFLGYFVATMAVMGVVTFLAHLVGYAPLQLGR